MRRSNSLILVLGGGSPIANILPDTLDEPEARLIKVKSPEEMPRYLRAKALRLVILCLDALDTDGLKIFREIKNKRPDTGVVIVNRPKKIHLSIAGMNMGALADYLLPLDMGCFLEDITRLLKKIEAR